MSLQKVCVHDTVLNKVFLERDTTSLKKSPASCLTHSFNKRHRRGVQTHTLPKKVFMKTPLLNQSHPSFSKQSFNVCHRQRGPAPHSTAQKERNSESVICRVLLNTVSPYVPKKRVLPRAALNGDHSSFLTASVTPRAPLQSQHVSALKGVHALHSDKHSVCRDIFIPNQ